VTLGTAPTPQPNAGVSFTVAFGNRAGQVNGAVVKVAAGNGLFIGDVQCSIHNRGPCLSTASIPVAQAASGFAIPTLPGSTTGLIVINGLVTATSGTPVTVTVTITPPAGMSDGTPADNSYTLTATAAAPAQAGGTGAGSGGGAPAVAAGGGGGPHLVIQTSADLVSSIIPSGAATSWPANGYAKYDLMVRNVGPDAADGATITVPASSGLRKWMVWCDLYRGASWNLTIAEIENGFVIPTFPAGNFFECTLSATVTGAVGSDVTLTLQAAAPRTISDPNPGNNSITSTLPIR
jgi:hypothetical protein